MDSRIVDALGQSDVIFLEVDKSSITFQEFMDFQNDYFYLNDESLPDIMEPEDYRDLVNFVEEEKLELRDVDTKKIWVLTSLIHEQLRLKEKVKETFGIESYISNFSLERDIPIRGLEHPFSYYTILDQTSLDLQIRQLMDLIQDEDPLQSVNMDSVIQAWKSGDQRLFEELYNQNLEKSPANFIIAQEVNRTRNRNWVAEIVSVIESGKNAVIAIGASHLIGPDSVIAYLEKKGFHLTQIGD